MTDLVRLDPTIYSWTSLSFVIAGSPFEGVTAVQWEQTREAKQVYVSRKDGTPVGQTSGKVSVKGLSITMLEDSANNLKTILSALGLGSYGDPFFPILIISSEPIIPIAGNSPANTSTFLNCKWGGEKAAYQEGIDENLREITFSCLRLTENGTSLSSLQRAVGL